MPHTHVRHHYRKNRNGSVSSVSDHDREINLSKGESDAATELALFTENDGDIYRQQRSIYEKGLEKRWKKGDYDPNKAEEGYLHTTTLGAKKYVKEHGSPRDNYSEMFPKDVRRAAARTLRRR